MATAARALAPHLPTRVDKPGGRVRIFARAANDNADADTTTQTTAYEAATSRVHTVKDALGQIKQFAYTQDDRVSGITYTGAVNPTPSVSFAYDPNFPRLTSMTDGGGTTTYSYVPVGSIGALALQQETQPLATIAYVYDKLGRLKSRAVTGAGTETFGYDGLDRLTSHAGDLGAFTLGYLGQTGQITTRSLTGSLLATNWGYLTGSGDRRLASVATTGLSSGQSTGFAYTTNAEALITGTTQTTDGSAAYPAGAVAQTGAYSQLNQLTNLTGQHLTWDAVGNLLSDGMRTYSWDAENRLVAIAYTGVSGKATTFAYDGLGRRTAIASTPAGGGTATTTSYVWCGSQVCQARTAAGAEARGYYAEGEYVPGSGALYYAPDNLGSVRRVFSEGASPSYDYDPYGAPSQATAPVTDFAYAGMVYNADSGLYLTTRRPYDPASGRFLSRDSIGEDADPEGNLYAYVGGNPVGLSDPTGRGPIGIAIGSTLGFIITGGVSLVADYVTFGGNAVATPAEVGFGTATGGAIGNAIENSFSGRSNASFSAHFRPRTDHYTTITFHRAIGQEIPVPPNGAGEMMSAREREGTDSMI